MPFRARSVSDGFPLDTRRLRSGLGFSAEGGGAFRPRRGIISSSRLMVPREAALMVNPLLLRTRRHFFHDCALGVGAMGLTSLLNQDAAAKPASGPQPHFKPRAKSVIYLFMAGGPSQLELFDYKPQLQKLHNQPIPGSYLQGKRFAFMDTFAKDVPKLLGTRRQFAQHGQSGAWVSELLPHTATIV